MRSATVMILILVASVVISLALYWLSGGRLIFFGLPLLFIWPLAWQGRRSRRD